MNSLFTPLAPLLHALAQGLLYPVLTLLLLAAAYLAYQAGVFLMEWRSYARERGPSARLLRLAEEAARSEDPALYAERRLAEEELALARRVERTDLLVRLGPALGLAGTLIPLGPGLAALGRGEVRILAEALTVAFDTTVLGILIGSIAFVLSGVRRRWYEGYILRTTAWLEDELTERAAAEHAPTARVS
jgi:biopolymer transport protein ExbB/TolQ